MLCFWQYCSKDKTFPIMDGMRPLKKLLSFFAMLQFYRFVSLGSTKFLAKIKNNFVDRKRVIFPILNRQRKDKSPIADLL
jgi:hypothetical protein